jgi:integrase
MYAEGKRSRRKRKAESGAVGIHNSNGRLQLYFSFDGKRYYFSTGLADGHYNRKLATDAALEIEKDIKYGLFDPDNLQKYKPQRLLTTTDSVTTIATTKLTLANLWEQYLEYKRPHASPKTVNGTYEPVTAHLGRCTTDGLTDALKFRMELLQVTSQSQARRTLMQLSAACKWGCKHGLIAANPFEGMYKELEASKPNPPIAFTVEERDRIITAFETHQGKGINYRHYALFIKFLFWTGCRPCEAIGLRWGSVTEDCSRIHFHESIVEVSGKLTRREETKTGVNRWFSCTPKLQTLLESIRPEHPDPEALVFPSPKGSPIHETNLNDRGWNRILTSLDLAKKDGVKMTLYNCRDTFITLQAVVGNSSTTIARWVGNSSEVIEKKYLDKLKLEHLRPAEI